MPGVVKNRGPAKGHRPDFTGVPGEIVSLATMHGLDFSRHGGKKSPYDALLDQLMDAPKDSALKFADQRARTSIAVRARKKGLKVEFAIGPDDSLYVRVVGFLDAKEPARQPEQPVQGPVSGAVAMPLLRAIAAGHATPVAISEHMRKESGATIRAGRILELLEALEKDGTVKKASDGSWKLTAKAA